MGAVTGRYEAALTDMRAQRDKARCRLAAKQIEVIAANREARIAKDAGRAVVEARFGIAPLPTGDDPVDGELDTAIINLMVLL